MTAFCQRIPYERARMLRELGRTEDAAIIETDLLRKLRLAYPDHPIQVRLREPQRRPFQTY